MQVFREIIPLPLESVMCAAVAQVSLPWLFTLGSLLLEAVLRRLCVPVSSISERTGKYMYVLHKAKYCFALQMSINDNLICMLLSPKSLVKITHFIRPFTCRNYLQIICFYSYAFQDWSTFKVQYSITVTWAF